MSRQAASDERDVAVEFPDDFPFNRRRPAAPGGSAAAVPHHQPEAQPMSQAQPISQPQPVSQEQSNVQVPAHSVRPANLAAVIPAAVNPAPAPALARRSERRRSPRQTLVAKAVIRSEATQTTVATGFISNISMLGVGFHTRRGLAVGEKFQLRVEVGPLKWATRLRVVSCQPHESGTYDVGAEFVGSDLSARALREIAA